MDNLELVVLAAALENQTDPPPGFITEERMREALTKGPSFTREERRLLWLSPDVREIYFEVRDMMDREQQDALYLAGYGRPLSLRAASGMSDVETIEGKGYVLTIFHDRIGDQEEWSLSLQLDEDFRSRLKPGTMVRFYDSGGVTWVKGLPDEVGQIGGLWPYIHETPMNRAANYQLYLGI